MKTNDVNKLLKKVITSYEKTRRNNQQGKDKGETKREKEK